MKKYNNRERLLCNNADLCDSLEKEGLRGFIHCLTYNATLWVRVQLAQGMGL